MGVLAELRVEEEAAALEAEVARVRKEGMAAKQRLEDNTLTMSSTRQQLEVRLHKAPTLG